jgi:hypothetical protein
VNLENSLKARLTIYNITGKKLLEKEITQGKQSVDLSTNPNGCYFVTITTEKEVFTKKIIINK